MESDIIVISDAVEIHPGKNGGWVVVTVATGGVSGTFAKLSDAKKLAKEMLIPTCAR